MSVVSASFAESIGGSSCSYLRDKATMMRVRRPKKNLGRGKNRRERFQSDLYFFFLCLCVVFRKLNIQTKLKVQTHVLTTSKMRSTFLLVFSFAL